jgi:hypothetical protein
MVPELVKLRRIFERELGQQERRAQGAVAMRVVDVGDGSEGVRQADGVAA